MPEFWLKPDRQFCQIAVVPESWRLSIARVMTKAQFSVLLFKDFFSLKKRKYKIWKIVTEASIELFIT